MSDTQDLAQSTTLANWRTAPYSRWSFSHVDALVAGAFVRSEGESVALAVTAPLDLGAVHLASGITAAQALETSHTDAFLALDNGKLCFETYHGHTDPQSRHLVFSVTKSVTGALAGILYAEGKLDLDRLSSDYVPELAGSAWGDATVRQVLDMEASVGFEEAYLDPDGPLARYRIAMDWNPPGRFPYRGGLHSFLPSLPKGEAAHGAVMQYASPTADVLGWILERASGEAIPDLFSSRIWGPIGAEADGWITVDRDGGYRTAGGLCVTARDLARFGEMMRLDGKVGDKTVVPTTWIADIHENGNRSAWQNGTLSDLFPSGHYRAQWYAPDRMPRALMAIGIHGQWLYVDPRRQVTLVKFSSQPLPEDDALDQQTLELCDSVAEAIANRRA